MLQGNLSRARLATALIGLASALYLAAYTSLGVPLACPEGAVINCNQVLGSIYAKTLHIPNAYLGAAFFVAVLALIYLKRPTLLALLTAMGVGSVVYFVYLEYVIGAICIYCTLAHIAAVLLFVFSMIELRHG